MDSASALNGVIARVRLLGEPTMIFLLHGNGRTLVFGVGHPESVLTLEQPDHTTFHSKGDVERRGTILFRCRGMVDEFTEEMAVPEPLAIEAAREFVATGQPPSQIEWEADW